LCGEYTSRTCMHTNGVKETVAVNSKIEEDNENEYVDRGEV